MRISDSGNRKPVLTPGSISLLGKPPNEDIPDVPVLFRGFVLTLILLLDESGEAGVDPVDLLGGKDRSFGKDLLQVLHGYGLDPSESLDVEDGPRVREDDGAVEARGRLCCPSSSLSFLILRYS